MPFISNTDKERREMLESIGVSSFDELIANIPEKLRLDRPLQLDDPLSELEVTRRLNRLAGANTAACCANSFLGGGVYDHFIPAAVNHIASRPEFLTAYTPYQAEVSQGTLQFIYEYQTMICELTGMEVANAGMYDGASAAAEAVLMACRKTRLTKAVLAGTVNPAYLRVIEAYTEGIGMELVTVPGKDGRLDLDALRAAVDDKTACVLLQTPNYLGIIEDGFAIGEIVHSAKKALFIVAADPISLAVLNAPSEYGADIVVGEGQTLGNKTNYGGPLFGFFAARKDLARQLPGRIVGGTVDVDGKRAYTLTLQAREQHIRREKATSNICSNESACTLAASVYMCLMGPSGLREVAEQSAAKAHWLATEIDKLDGFCLVSDLPFFKEFAIAMPVPAAEVIERLSEQGIYPGISLAPLGFENGLLVAVTEKKTKQQMQELLTALQEVARD
ncbi:MAG: aminomethyl-transferring glycine dehydrogenase subunit GcvPA [Candidatus Cloacimonetes bacterium]|nr:aminomethyl-transferring glycine dehydrogenase subunit GcvPA [Candidatus Cloacimonadota bacterium]